MRKISESTVRRLSLYLRFLEEFEAQGRPPSAPRRWPAAAAPRRPRCGRTCRSSARSGSADWATRCRSWRDSCGRSSASSARYRVAMIGAGKIGSALVQYRGFRQRGFDIVAIFDRDPKKIGRQWNGLVVLDIKHLEADLRTRADRHRRSSSPRRRPPRLSPTGWCRWASGPSSTSRRCNSRCRATSW